MRARRITYGTDPETPTVALDGGPPEPVTPDLVRRGWALTHDAMAGQSVPTSAELDDAAAILARRAAEQRAVAEDAEARSSRVDAATRAAAGAARRAALESELAELDEAPATDAPCRWGRLIR